MDFLKRNAGKFALVAIIIFFALPFIYDSEEEDDFSPFAAKSGLSYQSNPVSTLANRIASFYGFGRRAQDGASPIKNKLAAHYSFSKEKINFAKNKANKNAKKEENLLATSKSSKNLDEGSMDVTPQNSGIYFGEGNSSGSSYTPSYIVKSDSPVKGYVKINGEKYAVVEDAKGEKYVATPRGHIPYKEVLRRTISEEDFVNAKKRLGASDAEVLRTLQSERAAQGGYQPGQNASNYQSRASGYRNGAASTMGGNNPVPVSYNDKGFDNDALSNAFADLKNIDLKIDLPSSSSSSKSGGYSRSSYRSGSSKNEGADNPTTGAVNNSGKPQERQKNVQRPEAQYTEQPAEQESPEIQQNKVAEVQKIIKVGDGYETVNEAENALFIAENENNNYSQVWGDPTTEIINGTEQFGIVLPVSTNRRKGKLIVQQNIDDVDSEKQAVINQNVDSINSSIDRINETLGTLDVEGIKIYIGDIDDKSKELIDIVLSKNEGIEIVKDKENANIVLPGLILTPSSFKQFANELDIQAQQIQESQAANTHA